MSDRTEKHYYGASGFTVIRVESGNNASFELKVPSNEYRPGMLPLTKEGIKQLIRALQQALEGQ